jgi:hypothetical protein
MDHLEILQATGGLPPSAFTLPADRPPSGAATNVLNESPLGYTQFASTDCDSLHQPAYPEPVSLDDFLSVPSSTWTPNVISSSPESGLPPTASLEGRSVTNSSFHTDSTFKPVNLLNLQARAPTLEPSESHGKGRFVIPDDAKEILEQCFWEQPYPNSSKQSELAESTGLTARQVKTWFNNARSRRLKNSERPLHDRVSIRV